MKLNFRSYVMLQRPFRTLLLTLFYLLPISLLAKQVFALQGGGQRLVLLALLPAFFCGTMLTGPLLELRERSLSRLLPEAIKQLQLWHALSLAAAFLLCWGLSAYGLPSVPPQATAGLIAALLCYGAFNPLLFPHKHRYWIGGGVLLALFLLLLGHATVLTACLSQPWLLCLGGFACAFVFWRLHWKPRARTDLERNFPYYSQQSKIPLLDSGMMVHAQKQTQQWLLSQKETRAASGDPSGDSPFPRRNLPWVLRHSVFVEWSPARRSLLWLLQSVSLPFLFFVVFYFTGFGLSQRPDFSEYCSMALRLLAEGYQSKSLPGPMLSILPLAFCYALGLLVAIRMGFPRMALPWSRKELADALFRESGRAAVLQQLGFSLGFAFLVVLLQLSQNQTLGLNAALLLLSSHAFNLSLVFLALTLLIRCGVGLFGVLVQLGLMLLVIILQSLLYDRSHELITQAPVLLLVSLACLTLSALFAWQSYRRQCASCDLTRLQTMTSSLLGVLR